MIGTLNLNDPAAYLRDYGIADERALLSATALESDSGSVFRIRSQTKSWIIKIANGSTQYNLMPFKDYPDVVINNYRIAHEWKLSPEVIQADLDEKLIILEDIGHHCKHCDANYWSKLTRALEKLHSKNLFTMTADHDAALALAERVLEYEKRPAIVDALENIIYQYKRRGYQDSTLVASHGDISLQNVIDNRNRTLQFVDWDFAGNMPVYWDLAAILINHSIPVEHYREALKYYCVQKIDWADLSFFCSFYSLVASSWYATTQVREYAKKRAKYLFSYHQQITSRSASNA